MARTATVTRNTRETQITLTIDLDGTGKADLHTGIGFFDHMLDGFARHGLFDLSVTCHGDLDVDCHHTIEDIGIALGTAIKEALGDKAGLVRYGSCLLPMDETLALCAVDLGRAALLCVRRCLCRAELRRHGHPDGARVFLRGIVQRHDESAFESAVRRERPPQVGGHVQSLCQSPGRCHPQGCADRRRVIDKGDAVREMFGGGNDGRI